ncbi:MAG: hypothetical protein MGF17_12310 [Trichodesmium sp. MAG_R04]|nr:hypothetical protein [Trichodesmium sp. MAG_R04]
MNTSTSLSLKDTRYLTHLPHHLANAKMNDEFCDILNDFEFINHKISVSDPQLLIDDYDLGLLPDVEISEEKKEVLGLIKTAIQLSANALMEDKKQLPGQLLGRLKNLDNDDINWLLYQIEDWNDYSWLRPVKVNLLTPSSPLVRTIPTEHPEVACVAISRYGELALSVGKGDAMLKLWKLSTGELVKTLEIKETWNCIRSLMSVLYDKESVASITNEQLRKKTPITALAISPEGNWALSGTSCQDVMYSPTPGFERRGMYPKKCVVELWNLSEGKSMLTFNMGYNDEITSLALSSDGKYGLMGTLKGEFIICNFEKIQKEEPKYFDLSNEFKRGNLAAKIIGDLFSFCDDVKAVELTPDGRWVLAVSNDTLKIWDLLKGCLHQIILFVPLEPSREVTALYLNFEGNVIIQSKDNSCSLIMLKIYEHEVSDNSIINKIERKIANLKINSFVRSFINFWEDLKKIKSKFLKETSIHLPLGIIPQAISYDNNWAISITNDGGIQLWDLSRIEKTIK